MCQALQHSAGSRLLCVYACKHMSACACVCVCAHLKALWLTFAPIRWGTRILSPSFLLRVEFSLADNYFSRDCCIPLLDTRGLIHTRMHARTHSCMYTDKRRHECTGKIIDTNKHSQWQAKPQMDTLWFWTFSPVFILKSFMAETTLIPLLCTTKSFHNHRQVDRQ